MRQPFKKATGAAAVLFLWACTHHVGNPNTLYPFASPRVRLSADCNELTGRYKYIAVQSSYGPGHVPPATVIFSRPLQTSEEKPIVRYWHLMTFEILVGPTNASQMRIRHLDHEQRVIAEQVLPGEDLSRPPIRLSQRFECRDGSLVLYQSEKGPGIDMQYTRTLTRSAHDDLIVELLDVGERRSGAEIVNDRYWLRFRP